MTRLYLAGPMTNLPEKNYPAFHAEAARLRALGYTVVSPAEIHLVDGLPWADYMKVDIPLMLSCDGVARLPGWEASKGARIECQLAEDLGLPVSDCSEFVSWDPYRMPVPLTDTLGKLKDLAQAAEGVRFTTEGFEQVVGNGQFYGGLIMHENGHTIVAQCVLQPWADFIVAANPAVILSLIATIEGRCATARATDWAAA